MIRLIIPGKAIAKGRPRFARRGKFVKTYTPRETLNFEAYVKLLAAQEMRGKPPLDCALRVRIEMDVQVPASWPAAKRTRALCLHEILPTHKPDLDNWCKTFLDACNTVIYRDDSLICDLSVSKRYGEVPQTVMEIEEIGG